MRGSCWALEPRRSIPTLFVCETAPCTLRNVVHKLPIKPDMWPDKTSGKKKNHKPQRTWDSFLRLERTRAPQTLLSRGGPSANAQIHAAEVSAQQAASRAFTFGSGAEWGEPNLCLSSAIETASVNFCEKESQPWTPAETHKHTHTNTHFHQTCG